MNCDHRHSTHREKQFDSRLFESHYFEKWISFDRFAVQFFEGPFDKDDAFLFIFLRTTNSLWRKFEKISPSSLSCFISMGWGWYSQILKWTTNDKEKHPEIDRKKKFWLIYVKYHLKKKTNRENCRSWRNRKSKNQTNQCGRREQHRFLKSSRQSNFNEYPDIWFNFIVGIGRIANKTRLALFTLTKRYHGENRNKILPWIAWCQLTGRTECVNSRDFRWEMNKRRPREYIHTRMAVHVGRRERGNKGVGCAHTWTAVGRSTRPD
jgi:hypothetical protein